jgi:fermentation-respiration switch protein FrsA (DUF1100 family)
MTLLKWLLIIGVCCYAAVVAVMYVGQRSLLYFPDRLRRPPASVGLEGTDEVTLRSADGERLIAWYTPPREGSPVVLYFQGNGGGLDLRAHRFRALAAEGIGVLALNYRGYGGSTGEPTERGLLLDAQAAYEYATARTSADAIVLWGESLGTGVAVATAAKHKCARMVLESPYTSIADVAAATYWYLPARALVKDPFRAEALIGQVTAPVLVLQGARDEIIPVAIGKRLYAMIRAPKRFVSLPDAGHNDHDEHGALAVVQPFIAHGFDAEFPPEESRFNIQN